jgi:tRNA threonylcarbamoyladenosine biosynthesis protein TsaE
MEILCPTPQETQDLAAEIGGRAFPGLLILLQGTLGAGKTAFVQGLARGMGTAGRVRSPSYELVHIHEGSLPLFHFDLYRLGENARMEEFEDYFAGEGVCAVEWPEYASGLFGEDHLHILIQPQEDGARLIRLHARGNRCQQLLEELDQ